MKGLIAATLLLVLSSSLYGVVEEQESLHEEATGLIRKFNIPISFEVEVNDSTKKFVFYKTEYFTEDWTLEVYSNQRATIRSKRGSSEVLYQASNDNDPARITISAAGVASLSGIEPGQLLTQKGRFLTLDLQSDGGRSKIVLQPTDQKLYTLSFSIVE